MGLDMYLSKKYYVQNWEHHPPEDKFNIKITKGGKPFKVSGEITYIETEVMYWRKANAIHNWFVSNVQGGNDDCGTYYVSREQLQNLLSLITEVLNKSKVVNGKIANGQTLKHGIWVDIIEDGTLIENTKVAQELLPTTRGFFFGGTDYDQYYIQDLEQTRDTLTTLLNNDDEHGDFYYHSSW